MTSNSRVYTAGSFDEKESERREDENVQSTASGAAGKQQKR